MPSKLIDIAELTSRLCRKLEIVVIFFRAVVNFVLQSPVKREAFEVQLRQLLGEHLHIPWRFVRFVIDDPQCLDLLLRQLVDHDARDVIHPEPLRCQSTAVTDDDNAVLVDDERLDEAELLYRLGDVGDLRFVVPLGVLAIRN